MPLGALEAPGGVHSGLRYLGVADAEVVEGEGRRKLILFQLVGAKWQIRVEGIVGTNMEEKV